MAIQEQQNPYFVRCEVRALFYSELAFYVKPTNSKWWCSKATPRFFCTHLRSQYKQNEEPRLYFGYLQLPGYDGPILVRRTFTLARMLIRTLKGNTDAGMIGIIEVSELEKHATCKLVVQYNIGDCVVLLWDQNSATWTLWEKNVRWVAKNDISYFRGPRTFLTLLQGTHFSALGLRTLVQTQHYLLEEDVFDENMFDAVNDLPSNNEPRVDFVCA